jgi:hypothetical protein
MKGAVDMAKRSPRYPRQNLTKSLEMTRKLFDGAHQSKLDMDTAAKIIGYSSSASGAASSALGSLRQFGLVDGLRGDVAVSDLAMRILQPMDDEERVTAMHEAAMKPEMFDRIVTQFGGKLPPLDEPIRAFLIRQEGFSANGADELVDNLRETLSSLPAKHQATQSQKGDVAPLDHSDVSPKPMLQESEPPNFNPSSLATPQVGELITLPLGANCKAELRMIGVVNHAAYDRLIRHLELLREIALEEVGSSLI